MTASEFAALHNMGSPEGVSIVQLRYLLVSLMSDPLRTLGALDPKRPFGLQI